MAPGASGSTFPWMFVLAVVVYIGLVLAGLLFLLRQARRGRSDPLMARSDARWRTAILAVVLTGFLAACIDAIAMDRFASALPPWTVLAVAVVGFVFLTLAMPHTWASPASAVGATGLATWIAARYGASCAGVRDMCFPDTLDTAALGVATVVLALPLAVWALVVRRAWPARRMPALPVA